MPTFNEAEKLLLQDWTDARLIEDGMKVVRKKYDAILDEVLTLVAKNHRDLDHSKRYISPDFGGVAIRKDKWPKGSYGWPSGFFIENLQFEYLTSAEEERPFKGIWFHEPNIDQKEAEQGLRKAMAKDKRGDSDWEWQSIKSGAGLWCWLEQSREVLLQQLYDGDSRGFIDCMVEHFESLARFTPVVDEILLKRDRALR
jgi:hypothetical protein